MKKLLLLILLTACAPKEMPGPPLSLSSSDVKWKSKVVALQKRLNAAQKVLSEDQEEMDHLRARLEETKLHAVESKVEFFEKKWQREPKHFLAMHRRDFSSLMLEERETLSRMIEEGVDGPRVQKLLDRILQLITQMSDNAAISG